MITTTPEEGRQLASDIARHSVHAVQPDTDAVKAGRPVYATEPAGLMAAAQVMAIEFATMAAADGYSRDR